MSAEPEIVASEEPEEEIPEYEKQYLILKSSITDLKATIDSYSKRLFGTAANYKSKMELKDDAPGKNAFRAIIARVTALGKMCDKLYKQQCPKVKKEAGTTKHTGFNRPVLASPAMTAFMKLADWGLLSEVNPEQGVVTHGLITRYVSNYVDINDLKNPDKPSNWAADATLLKLFEGLWDKEGVNPKAANYTDIQKLVKYHMSKLPEGGHEARNIADYYVKLDDEGEFGGATKTVLELRKTLVALEEVAAKRAKVYTHCKKERPTQGITKEYAEILKQDLAQFDKVAADIRGKCENFGFEFSKNYPRRPAAGLLQ